MEDPIADKLHIGTSGWSYKDWVGSFYLGGNTAPRRNVAFVYPYNGRNLIYLD